MKKLFLTVVAVVLVQALVRNACANETNLGNYDVVCCDACCDTCGGGWFADYEHVLLKPVSSANWVFYDDAAPSTTSTHLGWDLEYSPRLSLGYRGDGGNGWQLRYWQFDHVSRLSRTEQAGENLRAFAGQQFHVDGTLNVSHSLELHVLDFEATREVDLGALQLRGAGGIRYVRMEQEGLWSETGGADWGSLRHDFEGVGPTVFLEGVGPVFGNLAVFANARGSILVGEKSWQSRDATSFSFVPDYDAVLPIGEAQVGISTTHILPHGQILSLRVALEGQVWINGGGISDNDEEMGLLGLSVRTGIEF